MMAASDLSTNDHGRSPANNDAALTHARRLALQVCHIAGTTAFIDEAGLGPEGKDLRKAIRSRDTAALFDHLVAALSYQGISDEVAKNFMDRHGLASWHVIEGGLRRRPTCPKLKSFWHFVDCRYNKSRFTCAESSHLADCPLPRSWLRNGRLNQTAYSLYLFVRDIADGDLVGWTDKRLNVAASLPGPNRLARMRGALVDPLREVYGVSDKVLTMALSQLLLGAPRSRQHWREVGGSMIAVDTLVHNFLHRTGILHRFDANLQLRAGLLPTRRLRRDHRDRRQRDRCQPVRPSLPQDVSAVRAVRDLAVLFATRSRQLQRQSNRRPKAVHKRTMHAIP